MLGCRQGTNIVEGNAVCIVIRTGDHTVIGNIAQLAGATDVKEAPLTTEVNIFVKVRLM